MPDRTIDAVNHFAFRELVRQALYKIAEDVADDVAATAEAKALADGILKRGLTEQDLLHFASIAVIGADVRTAVNNAPNGDYGAISPALVETRLRQAWRRLAKAKGRSDV